MGWTNVDTAKCGRCAVYTPTNELVFSSDGRPFCTTCGVQGREPLRDRVPHVAAKPVPEEWTAPEFRPSIFKRVNHPARVAALVMLAVTLCFPLAACIDSQL